MGIRSDNTPLYRVRFMLAFAYTHKHNGHVAIDVFEMRLPDKARTVLRIKHSQSCGRLS